ncbi:MAG TPA: archaetidylserine decarboxylase [Gammaproteobacteria bacterium]|nr:archaetidylserine decarboxylase [Gammaproteobacteria bacterium]
MTPAGVWLQHLLPQALMARVVYRAAHSESRWLKRALIGWFAKQYDVNLIEAELSDLDAYPSFNAFFTRALRQGARPASPGEDTVASPVDGRLTEFGRLSAGTLIQAKGLRYALAELVGEGPVDAERFAHGAYATLYLSPRDYHRVHMPVRGKLVATRYIPGRRYSVNAATTCGIRNLFCRNERVVCWFDTDGGAMALVLVGALNVSSISLAGRGEIASGESRYWPEETPRVYAKGQEIGRFNLGSTVIVLFPEGEVEWSGELAPGLALKLGEAIGRRIVAARRG